MNKDEICKGLIVGYDLYVASTRQKEIAQFSHEQLMEMRRDNKNYMAFTFMSNDYIVERYRYEEIINFMNCCNELLRFGKVSNIN
jgi:hypothetical protein